MVWTGPHPAIFSTEASMGNDITLYVGAELSKIEVLSGLGFKVVHAGPSDFRAFIGQELARWGRLVADRNLGTDQMEVGKARETGAVRR
jgi:hypothetical protein